MMLMLTAIVDDDLIEGTVVLAIRVFEEGGGCDRVKRLARQQIRKRHPGVDLDRVTWEVYEPRLTRGGALHYRGPARHFERGVG